MIEFPAFKPLELGDRAFIHDILQKYRPETSELSFTNLFIWREHYGLTWSVYQDCLLLVSSTKQETYAFPPVGNGPRLEAVRSLLRWLKEKGEKEPRIERVDKRLVDELAGTSDLSVEPTRDHFDYVYKTEDLVELAGRKYHAKRNHIAAFRKNYEFTYLPLTENEVPACLDMADRWCQTRGCDEDMNLNGEWKAVREALTNFTALNIRGGVIRLPGGIEAFALGELLNPATAVVHIEKANPDMRGLYAVINQQFCEQTWRDVPFINREQDLGLETLRQTKLSYYPDHMVEKFRIRLVA